MGQETLRKVLQLGIVVDDAQKAAEQLCQLFDVDPAEIQAFDMHESNTPMKYNGKAVIAYNVLTMVNIAGIEFEFIQYVDGDANAQKDFRDQCGQGIQHICINVDDYDHMVGKMQQMGAEVMVEGGDGEIGYRYMDMRDSMGLVFEMYNDKLAKLKGV